MLNKSHRNKRVSRQKNIEEFSGEKSHEYEPLAETRQDRKSNRTQQKNNRGNSKVESNDCPEIPTRGETSDNLGLPARTGQERPGATQSWGEKDLGQHSAGARKTSGNIQPGQERPRVKQSWGKKDLEQHTVGARKTRGIIELGRESLRATLSWAPGATYSWGKKDPVQFRLGARKTQGNIDLGQG